MSSERKTVISLKGVCKDFGGLHAVKNVSFDIKEGERHLIIGTNGAGKTTLFNLITGELSLTSGTVEVLGTVVNKMPTYRRMRLGIKRTYQTSALFDNLTVSENIYLAILGNEPMIKHLAIFKKAHRNTKYEERIAEIAKDFGLSERLNEIVKNLSHGERRQLELATGAVTKPKVLLLDEPGAGLSQEERQLLVTFIKKINKDVTVVIIEHDMELAFAVADNVTVMFDGEVIFQGDPETVKNSQLVRDIYLGGGNDDNSASA